MKVKNQSLKNKKIVKSRVKRVFFLLKSFFPLIFSHHPECKDFKNHTLNIGNLRLCIGCFVGYPSALLGILLLDILNLKSYISLQSFQVIGIICLSFFFFSFTGLSRVKIIKVSQKFFIGIGASFLYWSIWYQPISFSERYFIFLVVFGIVISGLNLYHVYGFYKNCHKCDIPFGWHSCEGFNPIRDNLEIYNLDNIFDTFKNYSEKIVQKRNNKELNLG